MTFKEMVARRKALGFTQARVAKEMGITASQVSRRESGTLFVTEAFRARYMEGLARACDEIMRNFGVNRVDTSM